MDNHKTELFGNKEEESNSENGFKINKAYATSYERWREKEELQKLKDRYEDGNEATESSESESDDFDPEDFNPEAEKQFLNVLSALKGKDPKIYDNCNKFFQENEQIQTHSEEKSSKSKPKKETPMFLKDYERKVIIEKEGKLVDEDDDDSIAEDIPYVAQQDKLKESFWVKIDDDEFLKPRQKSNEEKVKEEEEYIEWLKGQKQEISKETDKKQLKDLHDYWNDPNLDDGEKFLKDYVLNRRYLGDDDDSEEIPSYNEIVADDEEDEKIVETQEQFERKYNFRFEEPDEEFVKSYPRTVKDSLRRKDESKKRKREMYKEKKEKEKQQKREELKRLKNLKRKEIVEKLQKLKTITGNDDLPLDPDEFEKDFDPANYDKKMAELFNEDYYSKNVEEEEKPVFTPSESDDTDEEGYEKWQINQPGPSSSKKIEDKSKKRKSSKLFEALERKKPIFEPKEKTFEQYFDEYYKLDYEDIVGDTVCRFKYRKVVPNDFGLSTEEILKAKPQELNAWVSVRKMSQYREQQDEMYDVSAYKKKAQDFKKKEKVLSSLFKVEDSERKNSKKKKQKKEKLSTVDNNANDVVSNKEEEAIGRAEETNETTVVKKKKKKPHRKSKQNNPNDKIQLLPDERLKAYGLNPKKVKNKLKYTRK